MPLQEGDRLQERYLIRRVIKSGGMGSVFLAEDSRLEGLCAVKEMHPSTDSWAMRRFREEALLLSKLQHPAIPKVRDFFIVEQPESALHYLVMDYIDGQNLQQEFIEAGPGGIDAKQVREDSLALLDVLNYLHKLDPPVIHRDLKPANLIREKSSGKLFLVDFGLARTASDNTQTTAGTLTFCSPEQMLGRADARSDLYSLAATAYFLLSGQTIQMGLAKPILFFCPELPPEMAQAIDTALLLDPDQRFPDAAAMRRALLTPVEPQRPRRPWKALVMLVGLATIGATGSSLASWKMPAAVAPTASSTPGETPVEVFQPKLSFAIETTTWNLRAKTDLNHLDETVQRLESQLRQATLGESAGGSRYLRYQVWEPPDKIEVEVGVTLPEGRPAPAPLKIGHLPGGQVAKLVHSGPYENLLERHQQLRQWVAQQGLKPAGGSYSVFRIGSDLQPVAARWETDLCLPLSNSKGAKGRP